MIVGPVCFRSGCFAAVVIPLVMVLTGCATPPSPPLPDRDPKPFGSVWIDAGRHELVITGFVNQVSGPVELLACGPGGKTHESVLVLFARPHDIQAGLLLLGFKHGAPMPGLGMGPPKGDRVQLDVLWEEDGQARSMPAEQLLRDVQTKKPVRHGGWIFNGSMMQNETFMAQAEESYVATYWDPWAIINLAGPVGEDDERLVVNPDAVPPHLAPVRLIIRPDGGKRPQ